MEPKKLTLEEKVDLLLKYQISARRWALVKGIFNFLLIFFLVILPVILAVKYFDTFKNSEAFQNLQNITKQGDQINQLNQLLKQLPQR